MFRPQNSNPSPLESYLRDDTDAKIWQRLASQSILPNCSRYRTQGYHGAARDERGTSMMLSGGDHTRGSSSQDLAALTSASTRSTSVSVPSSVGARQIDGQRRLVDTGPGTALVLPPFNGPRILECPFNLLFFCQMAFSDADDWIAHSLEHFRNSDPPTSNACCFCDKTFQHPCGAESWRQRMQHIAWHHGHGCKLAHARPDFELITYLFNEKLISNADYKELKGNSHGRVRAAAYTQTHSHRHRHRTVPTDGRQEISATYRS